MAQPTPSEAPRWASTPFDDPTADLILRTSDLVDFRVFRLILRLASPVFASMLEVGQAPPGAADRSQTESDESRDGCPVVPIQEDSTTVETLLRIIYPMKDPALGDLPQLHYIIAAALKYEMEQAVALGTTALLSFVSKEPLRVWAIAARNRLEVEARTAADEVNRQQISVLDSFPPEMQDITAGAYYRLLRYRRLGGAVEEGFGFCDPPLVPPNISPPSPTPIAAAITPRVSSPDHSHLRCLTDIICRSSDGQDFPTHRILLALASPVMAGLVTSLPEQHAVSEESGLASALASTLPVLSFDEDGATLKTLIGLCHPNYSDTDSHDLLSLSRVFDAVKKYEMDAAMEPLQREWSQLVASDPLLAYILAVDRKSSLQIHKAAVRLLDRTMEDYYVPILEGSPASTFRNALLYHRACKAAASDVAHAVRTWIAGGRHEIDLVVRRKFPGCTGTGYRYACCGYSSSDVYRNLQLEVCSRCISHGESIIQICRRLESPSGALFTTLKTWESSLVSSDEIDGVSSEETDPSAVQTLYKTLFDKVTDRTNTLCSDYIEV
ncbi:uncharacterized protein B0H18DRAFT_1117037 [Fomitopsis serialis]|uniref:uncharacterized protein n=1 Tax=Fomitopsis serialis TaxID=139415 RepID=UPI002008575C|nr:uncharacterized protein B0H18DRAFT_1117037 [Neoantrodia serialis]KAH9930356.1 hypothetical protein B0H18DRAFT_1117037 [Neoantrodia serialis]